MLHVPFNNNYQVNYKCWRSLSLGELRLPGYQIMAILFKCGVILATGVAVYLI